MSWLAVDKGGCEHILQKNLAEMKVIHYGFVLSYIYMGRGTQIPVAVTFLKVVLKSSSEGNYLGMMNR